MAGGKGDREIASKEQKDIMIYVRKEGRVHGMKSMNGSQFLDHVKSRLQSAPTEREKLEEARRITSELTDADLTSREMRTSHGREALDLLLGRQLGGRTAIRAVYDHIDFDRSGLGDKIGKILDPYTKDKDLAPINRQIDRLTDANIANYKTEEERNKKDFPRMDPFKKDFPRMDPFKKDTSMDPFKGYDEPLKVKEPDGSSSVRAERKIKPPKSKLG